MAKAGEETVFKIKPTTKMGKIKKAYAEKRGIQASSIRFLIDGDAVNDEQTPKMLELEEDDQIDCMLEQQGGGVLAYLGGRRCL